jgi:hypothetical protein
LGLFLAIFLGLGLGARYYDKEKEEGTTPEQEQVFQQYKNVV